MYAVLVADLLQRLRIASAISTFFFPLLLSQLGLSITLYIAGGLLFIGFIVSYFLAPEAKNII